MGRTSDNPVRHVVSFRINLEEKERLEEMARNTGCSISEFVRSRLHLANQDCEDIPLQNAS